MGKSTIWPFSIAMLVYQRVSCTSFSFCSRSPHSQILFTILMTWPRIIPTSVLTESWSKTLNLLQSFKNIPTTSVLQTSFIAINFQSALIVLPLGAIIVGGCESWPLTPLVVTILIPSCGVVSPVTMGDAWLQWDIHGPVCIHLYIHTPCYNGLLMGITLPSLILRSGASWDWKSSRSSQMAGGRRSQWVWPGIFCEA